MGTFKEIIDAIIVVVIVVIMLFIWIKIIDFIGIIIKRFNKKD